MFDLHTELNLLGLVASTFSLVGYVTFIRMLGTKEADETVRRVKVVRKIR